MTSLLGRSLVHPVSTEAQKPRRAKFSATATSPPSGLNTNRCCRGAQRNSDSHGSGHTTEPSLPIETVLEHGDAIYICSANLAASSAARPRIMSDALSAIINVDALRLAEI